MVPMCLRLLRDYESPGLFRSHCLGKPTFVGCRNETSAICRNFFSWLGHYSLFSVKHFFFRAISVGNLTAAALILVLLTPFLDKILASNHQSRASRDSDG